MSEKLRRQLLIVLIVISLVPTVAVLALPNFGNLKGVALWASAIAGYMGVVLLLWMYVLGARSVIALVFRDIAPILKIHKWLGKYGTLAIFAHPILITYGYATAWFYSLVPQATTLSQRHILLGQIAMFLLVVIWVSSALIRSRMKWRVWRYIHWFSYVAIPFSLLHIPDLGSQVMTRSLVKVYVFSLFLTFCVITLLRLRSVFNLDKEQYVVSYAAAMTMLDSAYVLKPAKKNRYIAPARGQYVYVKLGIFSEDHPFSVAQYNEVTREISLAYRKAGMFTEEMKRVSVGKKVYLSGPYGSFTEDLRPDDPTPVVFIAGGIGVTPFIDRITRESVTREQWLFASNRSRELAVLYPPLKAIMGDYAVAIYNQADGPAGPNEEYGHITADLLKKYLNDPTRYQYYLCGPPGMMNALRKTIKSLGVRGNQIHSEDFGW